MGFYRQQAVDTGRGRHPDLTPDGDLDWRTYAWPDPTERDFNVRWDDDPTFRDNFLQRVADRQAQEDRYVQEAIGGREFGAGRGHYRGVVEYEAELARLRSDEDEYRHGVGTIVVRDHEVADMSLERYDQLFDGNGQPRPGVALERTNRSVRLDDGADQYTRRELGGNQ